MSRRARGEAVERITEQARALDTTNQAVIATDAAGVILYWSRHAEELYGWSSAEVMGRDILEVTPTDLSREEGMRIMQRLGEGVSWSGEFQVQRKDGARLSMHVRDMPGICPFVTGPGP